LQPKHTNISSRQRKYWYLPFASRGYRHRAIQWFGLTYSASALALDLQKQSPYFAKSLKIQICFIELSVMEQIRMI